MYFSCTVTDDIHVLYSQNCIDGVDFELKFANAFLSLVLFQHFLLCFCLVD